jgi:HPt (histidine-containing phosphotransfer) domain-containing protein
MNFDNLLSQLRIEYVSSLPEKIQIIRHFYNSGDALGVKEVFHKLKGTGATYGVPEISMIGETVEQFCKTKPQDMKTVIPDALALLDSVHTSRTKNEEFNVSADPRFQRICQLNK